MSGHLVRGAGGGGKGGGGSQRVAQEDPDSLRSRQYARVLDAICEGEIVGLVDGAKSIYLDDTPLQNADGSYNFQNVVLNTTTGTQNQAYLPGYSDVESEIAVSVEVKNSASVTRSITNTNIDRARITIGVPQLTSQDTTNGDLHGAEVSLSIQLQVYVNGVGGGFSTVLTDTLRGKTTTKYQRAYNINLTKPANCTGWDIRVVRNTADSTSAALVNKTWWDSYTEIIDVKLGYPNTALIGISIDASQFRAIPRRAYDVKLLKIKVPVNYDPVTRVYTGVWDGTFKTAWSDNPAWCFYDMCTNARYGLGEFISAAQVDKWSLYNIAQYCDELVPSGFGGWEPRFTCNLYLQTREEAYKVINDMASIFRAMVYWASGSIFASQDRPSDPVALFTPANVIDGMFHYEGSSRRSRYTVALVSWNDPADRYRQKIEYVEDAEGIARYGIVQTEVASFGSTSRGQARRQGKWILLSGSVETETVTFDIGLFDVRKIFPGAVIKVADAARAGKRWGGRIMAATTGAITVDALTDGSTNSITIEAAKTYTMSVVLPDGTVASSTVTNAPGSNVTVPTVSPAFSAAPQQHAIWVLEESSLVAQTFRVIQITETAKSTAKIVALEHNPSKFAAVEQGLALQSLPASAINASTQAPVTNITTRESLYIVKGDIKIRLHIGWDVPTPTPAARYLVEYRMAFDNWQALPEVTSQSAEILGIPIGNCTIRVTAISLIGVRSQPVQVAANLDGKLDPPSDITGFQVTRLSKGLYFTWNAIPDIDFDHYDLRYGNTWETAVPVISTNNTSVYLEYATSGTFLIKAASMYTEALSTNAAICIVAEPSNVDVVLLRDDGTTSALAVNCYMSHGYNGFTPAARTIEIWVMPTVANLAGLFVSLFGSLTEDYYTGSHPNHYNCWIDSAGHLKFSVMSPTSVVQEAILNVTTAHFEQNVWTQVVATYDSTGINLHVHKVGGTRLSGNNATVTVPNAMPGRSGLVGMGATSTSSKCAIDQVRMYNRALTTTEVDDHFSAVYTNETGLVLLWNLNENQLFATYDSSGNANTGTIVMESGVTNPWTTPGYTSDRWSGVLTNMVVDGNWIKTNAATGSYESAQIDLGYVARALFELSPVVEQVPAGVNTIAATYEIAMKDTVGGSWSAWQPFMHSSYQGRFFKVRANFTNSNLSNAARLKNLTLAISIPDRVMHFENVVVTNTGIQLAISPSFIGVRTALVTMQGAAAGDNYQTVLTTNSVEIHLYNAAGVEKSGYVDVDVHGWG